MPHRSPNTNPFGSKFLKPDRGMLARILGDATLTNLALLLALLGRYVWVVALSNSDVPPQDSLREHVQYYASSWWLITGVALLVFSMNGFYTRSRAYSLRYKFLLVAQAVSLVYLVFSFPGLPGLGLDQRTEECASPGLGT